MCQVDIKFDIVTTDLRLILSYFVETDVYVFFNKLAKTICNIMFKKRGSLKLRLSTE